MTDTTAKVRSKGCENTGLTEDLARRLWDAPAGRHIMAVVELRTVTRHGPDVEGKRAIDLVITQLEPAPNDATEEHLRNLTRSFHYERKLDSPDEQLQLETGDDIEPKVSDVLAAGKALEPHYFVAASDSLTPGDVCDVCGQLEEDVRHNVDLEADEEPEEPEAHDQDEEQDEQDDEPSNVRTLPNPFETAMS